MDDFSQEMVFEDLTPIEVPVKIGGEEYILKEATGDAACKWRNAQLRAARMERGKLANIGDIADCEPLLVSLCLFKLLDKEKNTRQRVPTTTVRAWPVRIQKALYDRVIKISGLEEEVGGGEEGDEDDADHTDTPQLPADGGDGAEDVDQPASDPQAEGGSSKNGGRWYRRGEQAASGRTSQTSRPSRAGGETD